MLGEAKPGYVFSILKSHFRVSSLPQGLSQALVCISILRKYPRSGYFLVNSTIKKKTVQATAAALSGLKPSKKLLEEMNTAPC